MTNHNPIKCLLFICATMLVASCGRKYSTTFTPEQRHETDSIIKAAHSDASLDSIYKAMDKEHNTLGKIVTLREWSKTLRYESRFDEALKKHRRRACTRQSDCEITRRSYQSG